MVFQATLTEICLIMVATFNIVSMHIFETGTNEKAPVIVMALDSLDTAGSQGLLL